MARKHAVALAVMLVALAAASGALAQNAGVAPPSSASESGHAIKQIYWVVFAACAFVFVAVEATLVLFVLRFRRRRGVPEDAEGPQIYGNTRLEVIWTIVPALILVALAVYTFARVPAVEASGEKDEAMPVRVESHQFYWQYVYPNGAITLDTLRLPLDRPVALELTSFDVNHSWWVPELTGKRDAIPGRLNVLRFRPTRAGTFENGKCAEHCGIQHAVMLTKVEVIPAEEFDAWVEEEAARQQGGSMGLGQSTWEAACAKCHGFEGEGGVGPPIAGNGTLTNREGLVRLLEEGQDTDSFPSYMPPVGRGWPARQVSSLIAYIRSNETLAPTDGDDG